MKCQTLFSGKNKKNIINLPSTENAHRVVKVKCKNKQNCQNCVVVECKIDPEKVNDEVFINIAKVNMVTLYREVIVHMIETQLVLFLRKK